MKNLLLLITLLFGLNLSGRGQQLYINEFMASNSRTLADGTSAYEDWLEIYNPNSYTVDIGGYYLTDNLTTPTKHQFAVGSAQTIIPANGYLLVWASGEISRGPLHVNFKLSADGEQIGLYRPDGITVVDSLTFGAQRTDISRGRQPDGSANWLYFPTINSSPGASNDAKTGYAEFLTAPVFSQAGGFYASNFNLSITSPDPAATIYYTLDGSDPDPTNPSSVTYAYKNSYPEVPGQPYGGFLTSSYQTNIYTTALPISDWTSSPNSVSLKSSTFNFAPAYFPTTPVYKGTVVRARAYKANALASDIITQTYFITPLSARYSVPVISIATTEKNLFDYNTGIYNAGIAFDNFRAANPSMPVNDCTAGNFFNEGDAWEKPGNVEFFMNNSPIINQLIGLRIHGGCSRTFPRKSLRLYGNTDFNYPFFSSRPASLTYNRLLLRSGGNDWAYSLIIDAYMHTMVRHLTFDTQANRPSVVFVNGEYWGVHSLYERYDKYYFNRNYAIDPDSVDIVSARFGFTPDEGDLVAFTNLFTYFTQNNPVDYTYAKTQIDVENLADYQIAEIFAANTDWPHNNQVFWRKRTSQYVHNAPRGHDGRWRWMLKDLDFGLSLVSTYTHPTIISATDDNEYTLFFRRLLDIPAFKSYFINRYADLLNTTFLPTRTVDLLNTFKLDYQPYMEEHFARWAAGNNYNGWLTNINTIQTFVEQRPAFARDQIRNKFSLTANRSLTVTVSGAAQGYVRVNTIDILPTTVGVAVTPYPWTGIYFQGNVIRIVAKPKAGYKFQHWKEGSTVITTDTAYSYNPTANRSLLAVFDLDDTFDANPRSFTLLSCDFRFDQWSATAPAGTYPANMQFVTMNQADPTLSATIADTVSGPYNYTSSTRINGLGTDGISFINTGGGNTGYPASSLGGALLALRTTGLTEAAVQWRGGTVTPNSRQYRIRLRYRIGDTGPFTDLLDGSGNPVEYMRNAGAGHSQVMGPVSLPAGLLNKPYIQLLWQYYWSGVGTSGPRDQLRVDDIVISRGKCESVASGNWNTAATWTCGRVPTACDDVFIKNGHVVTLTGLTAVAKSVQFETNARLVYQAPATALSILRP